MYSHCLFLVVDKFGTSCYHLVTRLMRLRGGPLEKGGGGSENKNRAGETERKKFVHQKSLGKKFVQSHFSIWKIIS
jgi:hypothetical protein